MTGRLSLSNPLCANEPAAPDEQPASADQAGEDVGQPGEPDPLEKITARMLDVRRQLAAGDTSSGTQTLQQQIADDLARLINELKQKQLGQPSATGGNANADSSQHNTGVPGRPTGSDSDAQAGSEPTPPDVPVAKEIWGHLPLRVREQIKSSAIDEFLPQYAELIEAFYRRLSEEEDSVPPSAPTP